MSILCIRSPYNALSLVLQRIVKEFPLSARGPLFLIESVDLVTLEVVAVQGKEAGESARALMTRFPRQGRRQQLFACS